MIGTPCLVFALAVTVSLGLGYYAGIPSAVLMSIAFVGVVSATLLIGDSAISARTILHELEQMVYVLVWDKPSQRWLVRESTPSCEAIYGHTPEEMKAENFDILTHIHPEDVKRINEMADMTFPTGFQFVYEKRVRGRDPEEPYKWIRSKAVLVSQDEVEQVWLGMFDSISDLKSLCDELQRTRSHIAALDRAISHCFEKSLYIDHSCLKNTIS